MPSRFLTPAGTFDRSAIMAAAWTDARAAIKARTANRFSFGKPATLRQELAFSLARVWARAKAERGLFTWTAGQAERDTAEATRRAGLSARQCRLEDAQAALTIAEHNDTLASAALVQRARANLHVAQFAA